jgi:hypothetical protein
MQLQRHATPFPFLNTPNTLGRDRIVVPMGQNHGPTISFDVKTCGAWKHDLLFESVVDDGGSEAGERKQCADVPAGPRARGTPFAFQ